MTILVLLLAALLFSWILAQEWRELTRNNRYAVKLGKARHNERMKKPA